MISPEDNEKLRRGEAAVRVSTCKGTRLRTAGRKEDSKREARKKKSCVY